MIRRCLMVMVGLIGAAMSAEAANTPMIVSSQVRANDPTVLDVVYKVTTTGTNRTVNVRALAFEDGVRSFQKVVRPETFIDGTAANLGDNIAVGVEHRLAWKVSSDWKTDLAKCKFEILVSDQGKLPLDWMTVPGVNGMPDISFTYNSQSSTDVLNALFWYYANGEADLVVENGSLRTTAGRQLASGNSLSSQLVSMAYIAEKMGLEVFAGVYYPYVQNARRKNFAHPYDLLCIRGTKGVIGDIREIYVGERAYCVIDVSGGPSAASYPVSYLDSFPLAGWNDVYKTTKILLRRIAPGTVTLGGTKPVTLTQPYYMGVFEVTQKQYELVRGTSPSHYKGAMCPVEQVSWNTFRGDSSTYDWPNVTTVDPASFIGRLQAKTGLAFDLPTEAQWEFACRAGTISSFNNGGSATVDMDMLGRYWSNRSDGQGGYAKYTTVGSYAPNAFGLYDMHGNVWEWCLDWYTELNADSVSDWGGVSSGLYRVVRGGCWYADSDFCGSSTRSYAAPSCDEGEDGIGFRLSRTLNNNE